MPSSHHAEGFVSPTPSDPSARLASTSSGPEDALVDAFLASMPKRYRREFDRASVLQHARIAAERGGRSIHADWFGGRRTSGQGICVVAPDARGLLAAISTGLMLEDFDISRADAYTRRLPNGDLEAVDLFWVSRTEANNHASTRDEDLRALQATLTGLLSGGNAGQRRYSILVGSSSATSETSVRFRENYDVPWLTLELESRDRPGLLAAVTSALAAEGIQIVESRIRTHGQHVEDSFDVLETDGTCPTGSRLQRLQLAVINAVDGRN